MVWKKCLRVALVVLALVAVSAGAAVAGHHEGGEDPTEVDPQHYKVLFENDKVRVLRITYGPRDKSVMHYHPESLAYFPTDSTVRMTFPDGSSDVMDAKAGQVTWGPAGQHQPENLGDHSFEVIQVEFKAMATEEDVAAIGKVSEMEAAGVRSGDPETAARVYADDVVFMAPGEPAIHGKDGLRAWLGATYEQFDLEVDYASSDVTVAGDWAFEHYTGSAAFKPKDGGEAIEEVLKGIHIYRRGADGTWQITHDVWNADTPPPPME